MADVRVEMGLCDASVHAIFPDRLRDPESVDATSKDAGCDVGGSRTGLGLERITVCNRCQARQNALQYTGNWILPVGT